jgi:8-amino-7-oxononanoate synthase
MYDAVIDEVRGRAIRVGPDWLTDFASCNYLGFDLDPEIIDAIDREIRRWGTHPGWSRLLGSPRLYPEIEERLTELTGAPDTLVLPTITHIHLSVLPVLVGRGTVFVEAQAHRTIYDGAVQARGLGATVRRFRQGDLTQLSEALRAAPSAYPRVVCVDGLNSMTGQVPDLPALARLCRDHGALLYVDDAHGFGILGERRPDETSPYGARGNGLVRHLDESYDGMVLVGGFSKAYSSLLAFVALPTALKNRLKVSAAPYLYSGPSPVASLAGVLAGFDVNAARGEALRGHLYRLSTQLHEHVEALGLTTPASALAVPAAGLAVPASALATSASALAVPAAGLAVPASGFDQPRHPPIIELPVAAGVDLADVARTLWAHGIYVTLAAYPLVPRDQVGFRVQLTALHTHEDVERLTDVLAKLAADGTLRSAPVAPA